MDDPRSRLRTAGLRVTRPRVAVLEVLDEARRDGRHLLVAEVSEAARRRLGSVSTQAVYDCLEALTAVGAVRRLDLPGSAARFETRVGDNHHHLHCRSCGSVVDVPCATGAAPCLTPGEPHGFALDEAEVVFHGLCPQCSGTATASSGATGAAERAPVVPSPAVPTPRTPTTEGSPA